MGSLHLLCGEKEATLKCEKDLSFNNFDQFVRLRFGIAEGTVITYFNENGEEIIPSFESKTAQVIVVTALLKVPIAGVAEQKLSRSDGTIALTKPPKEIPGIFLWNLFIVMVPTFLILAIAYSLRGMLIPREPVASSGTSVGSGINSDEETSSFFQLLRVNWALFSHEFDLIEIWIGFLAWSSTNLFIRRLLNPEIGTTAFEKYGCDSIFGGMSAAVTVLLKAVLKKSLRDMQQQQV